MFITKLRADSGGGGDKSPSGSFWFTPIGARTASGVRVTSKSALALPTVFACGRVLAESFAVMPFVLYEPKAGEKGRTRVTKHWLRRLFCKAPNRFQSPYEWRLMLQWHLVLRGNAFCQITTNSKGEITELLPLHPDRMCAELLPNGSYRYRYTDQQGRTLYYLRSEIWHLRLVSEDGVVGLNPIEVEREAIGEGLAMQSYASRFFANDAKPGGGWIEYPGSFATKAAKQTFRDSWQELQGGSNRGKVAVLERGMKFHELGLSNEDAQFIEARGYKTADVCRIFRVPPHKVQDLTRSTNNNIEHQSIEFWTDTMWPYAELWESSIEFFLLGEDSDLEPEFDMSRMLRGDSQARAKYIQALVTSGVMTRNEARDMERLDPLPGLDQPLAPLNMGKGDGSGKPADGADEEDEPDDAPRQRGRQAEDARAGAQLQLVLHASVSRLTRRAVGALAKRPAAEVFDADFSALMADALGVPEDRADAWRHLLAGMAAPNEDHVRRCLLACANER